MKKFILKIKNLLNVVIVKNNFIYKLIFKDIKEKIVLKFKKFLIVKFVKNLLNVLHTWKHMKKFILKIKNILNVLNVENNFLDIIILKCTKEKYNVTFKKLYNVKYARNFTKKSKI